MKKTVCITGTGGFIGFHLARKLLERGWKVVGIDSLDPYYDVRIKRKRLSILKQSGRFVFYKASIADYARLERILKKEKPRELVHLAAQAGVRYSLKNPWAYATANYLGTLNIFEAAKRLGLARVVYASSSSVYGRRSGKPFVESDRTDTPISVYGATKKANEVLAHSYFDMYGIEMIGLRFFTVYGRWGRPDLALFKFTKRILEGRPVELYNRGDMSRSFTHIDDVVAGIVRVLARAPKGRFAIYNLGGARAVRLTAFVSLIEKNLGRTAKKRLLPMQAGDAKETIAGVRLARKELGYVPKVSIEKGIGDFVQWFLENKDFLLSLKEPKQ